MAKTKLDDETTAALTLFNEYVAADRERTQREKRLKKAERAKDDAATLVKKLSKRASSKERSEAEDAYRAAADKWQALRDGKEPPADPKATEPEDATGDEPDADAGAETTAATETEAEAAEAERTAEAETPAEAETEAADQAEAEPADQAEAEPAASDRAEAEPGAEADTEPEAQAGAERDEVESESDDESGPSEKPTG